MSPSLRHLFAGTAALGPLLLLWSCQSRLPGALEPSEAYTRAPQWQPLELEDGLTSRFRLSDTPVEAGQDSLDLQPIHVLGSSRLEAAEDENAPSASIELHDVLISVERHFPVLLAAREELKVADARLLSAEGGFDTRLNASALSELDGFYQSDRVGFGVTQPLVPLGAEVSAGYRLGRGDFAVYDGKAKTDDGGEYRLGLLVPLLQNRAIDPRRVAVWKARLARDRAEPELVLAEIAITRDAALAFWNWVAAGRRREIAQGLLELAQNRMEQVNLQVDEGALAEIDRTENQRLIVDRQATLVRAERALQQAAIALSLFWRDANGQPAVPPDEALPYEFPVPLDIASVALPGDEELAYARRPELAALAIEQEELRLEQGLAQNSLLPRLDLEVRASQDVGGTVNDPDDKGPFEFGVYLDFDVPVQRSRARGQVRLLQSRLIQLEQELQFARDRIGAQVRDARSALVQSWGRIAQARENVALAVELADAENFKFREGGSDLLRVNLREQQAAVAAAELVAALEGYFAALTAYRAAIGVPYLEELLEADGELLP
ncbi:MAG: TolC family protein [Planctomycetota bacterium]